MTTNTTHTDPQPADYFAAMTRATLALLACRRELSRLMTLPRDGAGLSSQSAATHEFSDRERWRYLREDTRGLLWLLGTTTEGLADLLPVGSTRQGFQERSRLIELARSGNVPSEAEVQAFAALVAN